jgi:hypothetical protein
VSAPKTFFNSDFEYDINPLWFVSSIVGTGSVAKTAGESSLTLSTGGTASGAGVAYQTTQYFRYEPGKGRFVVFSGLIGAATNNVRSRMGNFDSSNGVFFEMADGLGASVNQRSNVSGSVVDTKVLQTNWSIDKFDGTGPSGVTLDFSKTQLFWVDFQWMGTGHTRFGFFVNGFAMACHEIYNDNVITSPYTNTACLPMRAEIFNTGIAASTTTMKWVCCSLVNEGSPEIAPSFIQFTADNGSTLVAVANGTLKPVLSIQPKLTFAGQVNRVHILLKRLAVQAFTQTVYWRLVYNGTLTGASFASVDANSCVNEDTAATALSGGTVVASGYATAPSAGVMTEDLEKVVVPFTLDLNGANPSTYTVLVAGAGAAASVCAAFEWIELR